MIQSEDQSLEYALRRQFGFTAVTVVACGPVECC
jgi:hypothetical protein